MSIARVFAHLIECSDRRIPFQTLQTLLSVKSFRALAQISLKKYLSSLSSLSTYLLQNSLKTLIQTSSIFNNICLVSEFLFRVSILVTILVSAGVRNGLKSRAVSSFSSLLHYLYRPVRRKSSLGLAKCASAVLLTWPIWIQSHVV